MRKLNNKRETFIQIIKEICQDLNYQVEFYSQDWIIKICNKNITNFIIAYNFGINKDSSSKICTDKAATSIILTKAEIPNVEHKIFHIYDNYNVDKGNWLNMIRFFNKNGNKIVIKSNDGSGGIGVSLVDTLYKLEKETYKKIYNKSALCLSPFQDILEEYRIVMLDEKPKIIFKKCKPVLVGNGQDTILCLINKLYDIKNTPSQVIAYLEETSLNLNKVLKKGKIIELNWKHNLGSWATPKIVDIHTDILTELAIRTTKTLGIRFASVDIIKTKEGVYKVLEVNSGVMLSNFALNSETNHKIAKDIYEETIHKMMVE